MAPSIRSTSGRSGTSRTPVVLLPAEAEPVGSREAPLSASAGAIRSIDPGAEVILGGMAELAGVPGVMPAHEYLERLYRIKGTRAKFDGVSSHPYGSNIKGVTKQVNQLRRVMLEALRQAHRHVRDRGRLELGRRR